ncbi:MAG TPA: hypothetical protein VFJ19_10945 [Nocardioidaceae bacterium]|nr:hypothetical protein [Nocardioidaceae bacterium]
MTELFGLLRNNSNAVENEQQGFEAWEAPVGSGGLEGGHQDITDVAETWQHGSDPADDGAQTGVVVPDRPEESLDDDFAADGSDPCPPWCANAGTAVDANVHSHVSADVTGGTLEQPLVARLVQVAGSSEVRVLFNERVASVEEVSGFMSCVRQLLDQARPASAGLGFLAPMIARAGLTHAELADATGLEVSWLRAQSAGARVLSVREFDQLALAVAHLLSETPAELARDAS